MSFFNRLNLKWYANLVVISPMTLMLVGGALGGVIGALGTAYNIKVFSSEKSNLKKYIAATLVLFVSFIAWLISGSLLLVLLQASVGWANGFLAHHLCTQPMIFLH